MMAAIFNSAIMDSAILHKKNSIHSDSMISAILNSAMLDSDTAILDSEHLVIFSQINSKTLSLHSDSDSN